MGVKILFFSRGTLGQNSMFPEKGGQNSIFFPSALKKGGQNRGAYQPTSLKGCPPPPAPPPPPPPPPPGVYPKWPVPVGRLSKEWTPMIRNESNTMSMNTQWQLQHVFIFDQIQFRHAAMPVYWSLLLFPQIDYPRWLPHLVDSRRSETQLSVTSLWCDHGYNANANLWALNATHSVLIDAIIWQETLA